MRTIYAVSLFVCLCLSVPLTAGDLYHVVVAGHDDADRLVDFDAEPVLLVNDGYLVLVDRDAKTQLERSGLTVKLLAQNVTSDQLALDNRPDDRNVGRFPVVYEQDRVRVFLVGSDKSLVTEDGSSLIPIRPEQLTIAYRNPLYLNKGAVFQERDLTGLIDKVSTDSVIAHLLHLQAYDGRVAGTQSNYDARDWLRAKFQSYGYSQVTLDPFMANVYGSYKTCYNVVAYKEGTVYPNRQVVVGAHFDAVPGSPGADDNGTGTVGVLEIARALADVETEMSFVFITFDSEEQGLNGAWHYAGDAADRGDSIICMLNMDMIGHYTNNTMANVLFGPVYAYAALWAELADSLVNVTAVLAGGSAHSDHYAFQQNGYDVLFAQEYNFSSVYHTPRDSTTYVNFDYCTKLIQTTLATAYTINLAPLPVQVTSVRDVGDGQSLFAEWNAPDPERIDHFLIYYHSVPEEPLDSLTVPAVSTSAVIGGLTQGRRYHVSVIGVDTDGHRSVVREEKTGTPEVLPRAPENFAALPDYHAIRLEWVGDNTELDFSHYAVIRDGVMLPVSLTGSESEYMDTDFSLGVDFHDYYVVAVDIDGNLSDTVGVSPASTRAATLEPGRILAVNRSNQANPFMVNEVVTGEFMREALEGYDYVYESDTAVSITDDTLRVDLLDMIDYEMLVLGGESGRTDDFLVKDFLDTVASYISIGGKVVIFGRWGTLTTGTDVSDTIVFTTYGPDKVYLDYFHIMARVQYLTTFFGTTLFSDLVGAHSQVPEYPDLAWDSAATLDHSAPWSDVAGIPCPSFGIFGSGEPEVIYTYDSRGNFPLTEGKPVGWRYHGSDHAYVFFELPLSFMERTTAVAVLQTAVNELISTGPSAATIIDPDTLDFGEGPPATVTVYLGDFGGGNSAADVDQGSVKVNGGVIPVSVSILPSHPPFGGEVLEVVIATEDFRAGYGMVVDTIDKIYTVSWEYSARPGPKFIYGRVTLIGISYLPGDANGDWTINVGDPVYLIDYIFRSGPAPDPIEAGDSNCDGVINIGDAVYLVNFIFRGGPAPGCN